MGKKLAIEHHLIRPNEVIELLEMMGGKNTDNADGCSFLYYTLCTPKTNNPNNDKVICGFTNLKMQNDFFAIFTIEEFWEKYPYKVGDKVMIRGYDYLPSIISMKWEDDTIKYLVSDESNLNIWYTAERLNEFRTISKINNMKINNMKTKVEGMVINFDIYTEDEVELKLGDYEIEIRDGKTYAVKKKPVYPKTYEECCKALKISKRAQLSYTNPEVERGNTYLSNEKYLLDAFMKLRICRNAYWKIAGEQMGLNKPWDSTYGCGEWGYCIGYSINENKIYLQDYRILVNHTLVFPTKEMQDTFYENFKDLIEQCKELL